MCQSPPFFSYTMIYNSKFHLDGIIMYNIGIIYGWVEGLSLEGRQWLEFIGVETRSSMWIDLLLSSRTISRSIADNHLWSVASSGLDLRGTGASSGLDLRGNNSIIDNRSRSVESVAASVKVIVGSRSGNSVRAGSTVSISSRGSSGVRRSDSDQHLSCV